jgi:probable F420-dependent oxidoreductase
VTIEWLSTYLLPGRIFDPCDGPVHGREAETIGFGAAWLSDRWDQKEVGAMLGAVTQATSTIRLGTAATHPHTRHPLALAGMATTLQALSGGRFTLGLGRSAGGVWPARGLPSPTTRMLADAAQVLRRLWAGEVVSYDGPLGRFPAIRVTNRYAGPPPRLGIAAMGPQTLRMAGEHYDDVILHPFLTTQAVRRSAELVRAAAADAGRDPSTVRIVATVPVASGVDSDRAAAIVTGRLITYLQAPELGDLIAAVNGWDPSVVRAVRESPMFADLGGRLADWAFTLEELAAAGSVVPPSWIAEGAAVGDDDSCAARLVAYRDAGADEVMLHGNPPNDLVGLVRALGASTDRPTASTEVRK